MSEKLRIGVDIGGTFTDVVSIKDGTLNVTKTPSTPDEPESGVIDGLELARANSKFSFEDVDFLAHGTTVATNAVLEKEWAKTGLITTEGFRDILEIGRQTRPSLYDFDVEKPTSIVPRDRRFEIEERLDERGSVMKSLDKSDVRQVAKDLADTDVESVAVSLLFSFEDDIHERQIADVLREEDIDVSLSLSSEILPEIREYERTLTTTLNASLKPVMDRYLGALDVNKSSLGIDAELEIMQSNGGIISAEVARERPVQTLLSGPAAGVQGATYVAGLADVDNIITMDMGGTSCDASLVRNGEPIVSTEVTVGDYPVSVPMIDVHTIGAGGGSIAWIDAGGALRVGSQSAGADPGPICYGRGGTEPTVTDAQLVLGRINPENLLSDELSADLDAVREGIQRTVGDPLNLDVTEAAQGILDVANANMERALRVVSVERGHDPRDFGLVAYGGAGPLHACKLADELEIPRVIVPRTAGALSALGLLISDVMYDYSTSRIRSWAEVDLTELEETFRSFERQGRERLEAEGFDTASMSFQRHLDLRYVGQSFELSVPVPDGELTPEVASTIADRFHDRHEQRYGHASSDEPIELVTIRLRARGVVEPPGLELTQSDGSVEGALQTEREVVYDGERITTQVYDRHALPVKGTFDGPAVIEGTESTVVVHPNQQVRVDQYGNLIVETS